MNKIILFLIAFIIIYLIYFIFVINRKKMLQKWVNGKEITYLKKVYKIKVKDINIKSLATTIALSNSFIVALTVTIVSFIKNFVLEMVIGFIVLCLLILVVYHILGKLYQKKYRKK